MSACCFGLQEAMGEGGEDERADVLEKFGILGRDRQKYFVNVFFRIITYGSILVVE